jgi:hypothetical protein
MMDQESTIYFGGNFMSAYFLSSPCVYSVLFEDEAATWVLKTAVICGEDIIVDIGTFRIGAGNMEMCCSCSWSEVV